MRARYEVVMPKNLDAAAVSSLRGTESGRAGGSR
jgi:hypothetical protein